MHTHALTEPNFTKTQTTTNIYAQTISKYIYDTFNSERKREEMEKIITGYTLNTS